MNTEELLYDFAKLEKLCDNDTKFINRMLQLFIRDTPPQVEKLKNGLSLNESEIVRFAAHRLKPSVENICCKSIANEAIIIEKEAEKNNLDEHVRSVAFNFEKHIEKVIEQLIQKMENDNLLASA